MQTNKEGYLRLFLIGFVVLSPILFHSAASGQTYPDKPITLYCCFDPGATTDLTARALAKEATNEIGVPVVVENKPGGGSAVAATLLASKKADGYTLGVISSTALVTAPIIIKMNYDPFKDFTYVFSYGSMSCAICVRKDSPFRTLPELLDYARKNPEKVAYGATAMAPIHLAVDFLSKQANVKLRFVPFKGSTPAATALMGGHVDLMASAGIHRQYVKQGIFTALRRKGFEGLGKSLGYP
jgi:tripartite-type tricarboxylate transporter receptor subunit TctC